MNRIIASRYGGAENPSGIVYIVLFCFVSLSLFYSFFFDKHLSADGVHYFCLVLENGDFTYISWSRQFANYLTQWPLVLAISAGIKSISPLIKIFALGLYLPFLISFGICFYALRQDSKFLLIFPLLSIVSISLSADYILASESHVMVNMSWPILFLLLRKKDLTCFDGILLLGLLFLFLRLYESAIIPALLYILICSVRLYCYREKYQVIIVGCALLLSLLSFAISLYFIATPRDPMNKSSFLAGIMLVLNNYEALAAVAFIALFLLGLLLKKNIVFLFSLVPVISYIVVHLLSDYSVSSYVSFSSRTLSMLILPLLLISTTIVWYCNCRLNRVSMSVLVLFLFVMVAGNMLSTSHWQAFREQVRTLVKNHHGYINVEEISPEHRPYRWSWNNTQLGLVWSAPCVKTILLNSQNIRWQPFDPRERLILKKYLQYDTFFKDVDDHISLCGTH